MRAERDILIDADPEEIWELVANPDEYERFWHGLTRLERKNDEQGLGARFAIRMRIGSADVGGLVEIVECDENADMAWTSITGIDHRVRWRLREADDGRTSVVLRLSWDSPGGLLGSVADRIAAPMVATTLEQTLKNLALELDDEEVLEQVSEEQGKSLPGKLAYELGNVKVLIDAGVVRPMRPDRLWGVLRTLQRWGRSPAAGAISLAERYPDETMILDELGMLTYSDVDTRTNALAHALSDAGIVEGDGVGVMCRNHRGFIEATIALSKLGADALYLNTAFAGPQLLEVVQREKPKALIFDEEFYDLLDEAGHRRKRFVAWHDEPSCADPTLDELMADGDPSGVVPPQREGRAVILTSGTTGTPKGASRGNPESLEPVVSYLSRIPMKARYTIHIAAPLFHSWGFAHFSLGLILGMTYVLRRKFDPESCLAEVARSRADALAVVPVMMQRILDLPDETIDKYDTASLKVVAASGSALPGDLSTHWMDRFGDTLYNLYGSTEVAWATIATPADLRAAPGTAGRPPRGTIVKLFDEKSHDVKPGETGRIFVGNEMLFEGYTGGGSKDVIGNLMATGDVGRFDDAGRMFVEGRDDEMIVSGGENVFPKEVEDLLARHDAVSEAAAVGVEDKDFGQRLRAFVVLENGKKASEDDLKGYVKKNLARYKVPREIVFMDELPRNATGKVLKRELVEEEEKAAK
jgi:acyl-CoA synthetase (AMP-forming)/AMP-acid ligase II/carbon monoxide dehydrogenase subunit G